MKNMYIKRHNEAAWIILRSLLAGRLGASVVMHDVGHSNDDKELQLLEAAADWCSPHDKTPQLQLDDDDHCLTG
jgi:hypothetical protein